MLPNLPRQKKNKEATFGIKFRAWWDSQERKLPGEFELKDTRGKDSFLFSEFSADQETIARLATSKKGVLIRRTVGTVGGADYSGLVDRLYWIVIHYPKGSVVISVHSFLLERSRSKRKSLSWDRAKEIATVLFR